MPAGCPSAVLVLAALLLSTALGGQTQQLASGDPRGSSLRADVDRRLPSVMDSVIAWRRDIHEHPELSGQEVRTATLVATHLKALGLDVRTGVGGTGVVGVLK